MRPMQHPVTDPVCQLAIDPEYAYAVDGEHVFCSAPCQVTWQGESGAPVF